MEFVRDKDNEKVKISEWIAILLFVTSLFSATLVAVSVGGFQLTFFRFMSIVALLIYVVPNVLTKKQSNYSTFMLCWLIYSVLSFGWSKDIGAWFKEVFFLVIAYSLVSYFQMKIISKKIFLAACRGFTLFIAVHNAIGYYEMITRNYRWVSEELASTYSFVYGHIPVSVFYNSNNYATVLLFGIAVAAICFYHTERKLAKLMYLGIMASSTLQIYLTLSRLNFLALILGIGLFFLIKRNSVSKKTLLIIVGILALSIVMLMSVGESIMRTLSEFFNFSVNNGSEQLRLQLIFSGWDCFIESFGFGVGAGNLPITIYEYSGINGGKLHMWWLEVLFSYGFVIFLVYIILYIKLFKECYEYGRKGSVVSSIFAAFLIAYIIGACSSSSVIGLETMWAAWAIVIAYIKNYQKIDI